MERNRRPCAALKTHADAGVAVIGGSQRGGEGTAYLATRPHAAYRLGHGHTNGIAAPYDADLRATLRDLVVRYDSEITSSVDSLTREIIAAWRAAAHRP